MKSGMNWYKRNPVDYLGGVQGLTTKEHAVYSVVLDLIYQHGGEVNNDPSWIAGWIKDMGSSSVRNTILSLIEKGKLTENETKLTQKRAETEVKLNQNCGKNTSFSDPKSNENNNLARQIREEKKRKESINPKPLKKGANKTSLNSDFIPSKKDAVEYWREQGRPDLKYSLIAEEFITYCKANGKSYQDWDAAWQTFYSNAVKFNRKDDTVACNGEINPAHAESIAIPASQRTPQQWKLLVGTTPKVSYNFWREEHLGMKKPETFQDMVKLYE
tara:strand:+ start:47 stop:865 length:819 start_codon:yes stop_codon:yes gene_type:complete